ncbi:MAG: DsbA family oxidoreductase [Gammaproteobacteria bacterium]|nr:DsbA family oxidoreductase [Gammaproteobacteria bacterium]
MSETLSNITRSNNRVATTASLQVEVIADFVCPFCFIGKRRFDEALQAVQGPSDVSWYPYQLNPEMPAEGQSFDDYLSGRFGSAANVAPVLQYLAAEGKGLGIDFRFDKLRHVPNTVAVHQVMQLAEDLELDQSALADDLMSAFFEEGRNIGDTRELMAIAGTHGISADDASKAIDSDQTKQRVLTREGRARASGLAGVPGFLVNRRLLVVGAQSADNIVNAFDQAMFGEGTDSLGSPALH